MDKSTVIDTLDKMNEEFSTEEFIDKLLFVEKVKSGIQDVENGRVIPLDEVKERINSKWK